MAKKRKNDSPSPSDSNQVSLTIPDEAITFIINRYLQGKNTDSGSPIVVGIPTHVVEDVLNLFVSWAAQQGYIKDNILVIGGENFS